MGSQNNAREFPVLRQLLRDCDVQPREFEKLCRRFIVICKYGSGVIATSGPSELLEAAAQGHSADADKVLRSWGIR